MLLFGVDTRGRRRTGQKELGQRNGGDHTLGGTEGLQFNQKMQEERTCQKHYA
jgi:hypothetical protein